MLDLSPGTAWQSLIGYANDDLSRLVFERDASVAGDNPARQSQLLKYLASDPIRCECRLTPEDLQRLATWMDTYGHTQGAFSAEQEEQLKILQARVRYLLE